MKDYIGKCIGEECNKIREEIKSGKLKKEEEKGWLW
jgi:hypothetical protein